MLSEKMEKLRENKYLGMVTRFFEGDYLFPGIYAFLVLICSFFGLELVFYYFTALIVIFTTIFCRDSKPLIVPVCMVVYSVSKMHTPQKPYSSDYLFQPYVLANILSLLALVIIAFIVRLVLFKGTGNIFKEKAKTRIGMLALCVVFLINGIFYKGYTPQNLVIGFAIAMSFAFFYVYFYHTLEWTEITGKYIARVLVFTSLIIFIQIIELILVDKPSNKGEMILGWGMSNNVGGMLAMFLPACFYLALKSKIGKFYYIFGIISFFTITLTMSRASVLVGGIILLACMVYFSIKGDNVWFYRIVNIVTVVATVVIVLVFKDVSMVIQSFFDRGFDDSDRYKIWNFGLENFKSAPIFGVGFMTPLSPDYSYNIDNWIFPDMYHNTYIQMLASCGILGALAYTYHIVEGGILIFRKLTMERLFYFLVILSVSAMSMLDNHLFHIFPTMVYSTLIAVSEKDYAHTAKTIEEKYCKASISAV